RFSDIKIKELLELQWWNWDIEKITKSLGYLTGKKIEK
ncbi:MAG: chloramphenicol acetyltransferase, partial [Gammaproteobacteria bacterium]